MRQIDRLGRTMIDPRTRTLRCPFCGSADVGIYVTSDDISYAECQNCRATGPEAHGDMDVDQMKAFALEKWNHRPPTVTLDSFPPFPPGYCDTCARNSDHISCGTDCPIEKTYALPKDGYCHLYEAYNPIKWGGVVDAGND